MSRIGSRQHGWMYGGPNPWTGVPFRFSVNTHGKPPAILRNLVKKGWMWARRYQVMEWQKRAQNWSPRIAYGECGLTEEGITVIEEVRAHLAKAEEGTP